MRQHLMPNHVQKISIRFIFRIRMDRSVNIKIKEVRADSYDQAATIAARRIYGRLAYAKRVWGMDDFSGYFQAMCTSNTGRGNEVRLLGVPFHIQMVATQDESRPIQDAYQAFNGLNYIRKRHLI
jgi:hypothetical protein